MADDPGVPVDLHPASLVDADLAALLSHPDRHVGGPGNRAANDLVEERLSSLGWKVESVGFDALDWERGEAELSLHGRSLPIEPGPYTLPCDVRAPLLPLDSVPALESADLCGRVVLLHGPVAAEQLLPKSSTFLDMPESRRIVASLEAGRPAAVIAATGRGAGMAGALYPYPLIEDGDVELPNAFTSDVVGKGLARHAGQEVHLVLRSRRFMVPARQLTARRGAVGLPRIVLIAHIDSKEGSPGAIDNATGVAALLHIGRLLADYEGPYRVELLPMNGEDYYATPGEHLFVAANEGRWQQIALALNMDAVGGRGSSTAVSRYGCPVELEALLGRVMARHPSTTVGEPWYESDHSIVALAGRPTVALTSSTFRELCATVTHTPSDTRETVDEKLVSAAAAFVADVVRSLPSAANASVA